MKQSQFLLILSFVFLPFHGAHAQTFTLSGTVRDRVTGEPLVAANIRIEGTSRGTITNSQGFYRLSLERGSYVVIYSYIGYKRDTLRLTLARSFEYNAQLQASPIEMAEFLVTEEDPAMSIMRKVIENKERWAEQLRSYEFEAFTRQVMRRDTAIAMITESYSTGYWRRGDTLREVITQKRQTENLPGSMNVASVGGILNFYDDEIRFAGYRFVGPTSVEAFDYYNFKL